MGVLDLHADALTQAAIDSPYVPQPQTQKFSTWGILSAPVRGAGAGGREVGAFGSDILGAFGQVAGQLPGGSQGMFGGQTEAEERQIGEQRQKMLTQGLDRSAIGERLRRSADEMRPDPQTAHVAESILFDASRVITKAVGYSLLSGVGPGAVATGFDEGVVEYRRLREQGVDEQTALRAAGITGVATAAGVALPVAGSGVKSTAALYLAGGPGGYMAQQMLTRDVLQNAGYDQIAEQYDPFDPVGLAVSALIPLPFAAYGLRANRRAAALRSMPEQPPRDVPPADPAAPADVAPPFDLTPIAAAVREYSPDEVAAARVALAQETRAAANPADAADMRAADQHETALARAEEQISAGERVDVAAVAPVITPEMRAANFRAWFGESKVVDEQGQPLVLYHGSPETIDAFDPSKSPTGNMGLYFTTDTLLAETYARGNGALYPVYLSIKNPLILGAPDLIDTGWKGRIARLLFPKEFRAMKDRQSLQDSLSDKDAGRFFTQEDVALLRSKGYDGVMTMNAYPGGDLPVYVAFEPSQIKSAIGNSGRFDPTSPSLTDPIQTMAQNLRTSMEALVRAVDGDDGFGKPEAMSRDARPLPEPAAVADALQGMAREAYWSSVGGSIIRKTEDTSSPDYNDIVGRTQWIPAAEWFGRMRQELGKRGLSNQKDIRRAVDKAIAGEKLTASEQRTVDWMREEVAEMQAEIARQADPFYLDAATLAREGMAEGLSRADAGDLAMVARAAEVDEAAVERAAIQYENDDDAFMRAIKEIVDAAQAQEPTPGVGGRSEAGQGAAAAESPAARAEEVAALRRLDDLASRFPDLAVQMDGMDAPMPLREFLALAKAEADEMVADAPLIELAAQCALRVGG